MFVGNCTGRCIVVVDPNDVCERVPEVNVVPIRTPSQSVGNSNSFAVARVPAIGIEAYKHTVPSPDFTRGTIPLSWYRAPAFSWGFVMEGLPTTLREQCKVSQERST